MFRAIIAGLTYEAQTIQDIGKHFRRASQGARDAGLHARTIKEARYHEGRCSAYEAVADMLEKMEEVQ